MEALDQHPDQSPDQWMVRTPQNVLNGPYTQAEIVSLIREGKLSTLDEVCQGNRYWFFLHEAAEVVNQLGTQPPQPPPSPEDEITETEIRTPTGGSSKTKSLTKELNVPAQQLMDYEEEDTGAHLKNGPKRTPETDATEAAQALQRAMQSNRHLEDYSRTDFLKKIEGTSFWKGFTIFLTIVFVVLLISVFRLIQNPH